MSRSIHTTRRTVQKAALAVRAGAAGAKEKFEQAYREKQRKGRIKRAVLGERRALEPRGTPRPFEDIPVDTLDADRKGVVHGASKEDLLSTLAKLPNAAREGVSRIQLLLGRDEEKKPKARAFPPALVFDPITGGARTLLFPGVYGGPTFGSYHPKNGIISIYAFVVIPDQCPVPKNALNIYLKVQALKTLVHEIAHHHDFAARTARGRWMADRRENLEHYAEQMEHKWTAEVVIPYLEKSYPDQTAELLNWLEGMTGFRPTLAFFAGDPRRTQRDGVWRIRQNTTAAFEGWLNEFTTTQDKQLLRLAFSQQIHYHEMYVECLDLVNGIIAEDPTCVPAMVLKGDTLVHLDRPSEAIEIVEPLVRTHPKLDWAWDVRGDALLLQKRWSDLLENSECWLANSAGSKQALIEANMQKAIAYFALAKKEEFDRHFEELVKLRPKLSRETLHRIIVRRAGKA